MPEGSTTSPPSRSRGSSTAWSPWMRRGASSGRRCSGTTPAPRGLLPYSSTKWAPRSSRVAPARSPSPRSRSPSFAGSSTTNLRMRRACALSRSPTTGSPGDCAATARPGGARSARNSTNSRPTAPTRAVRATSTRRQAPTTATSSTAHCAEPVPVSQMKAFCSPAYWIPGQRGSSPPTCLHWGQDQWGRRGSWWARAPATTRPQRSDSAPRRATSSSRSARAGRSSR